ncbi:MAG: hypothetical protein D4S01_11300 [Dehalococcoidia bacterium]|nr:MAG: hypothetical protein D4S01_11300 [Dehalococcoidia bacterium]
MSQLININQVTTPTNFRGMVRSSSLGALFMEQNYLLSPFINDLYNYECGDDIIAEMNKYPTKEVPADSIIEWYLKGHDRINSPVISATTVGGTALNAASSIGSNGARWKMTFERDFCDADHIISGPHRDYHVKVVDKEEHSNGVTLTCELWNSDSTITIPYSEMSAGARWKVEHTATEQELSTRGTDFSYTAPFKMQQRMSFMRKEAVVPGNMIDSGKNNPYLIDFKFNGKQFKGWIGAMDYQHMKEFRREIANLFYYGKTNQRSDGTYGNKGLSGNDIKNGMGFLEQIAKSNIHLYSEFDIDTFTDYLLGLSINRLNMASRSFTIGTGEFGLIAAAKAIEASHGTITFESNRLNLLAKTGGASNTYGSTRPEMNFFASWRGINAKFVHVPQYDDTIQNTLLHPKGGPVESYRYTILNFGMNENNEPNIQRLVPMNQPDMGVGFLGGMRCPYTVDGTWDGPKTMATDLDGYKKYYWGWTGSIIRNPMSCGEWICNIV